jgi:hypothetical protein
MITLVNFFDVGVTTFVNCDLDPAFKLDFFIDDLSHNSYQNINHDLISLTVLPQLS